MFMSSFTNKMTTKKDILKLYNEWTLGEKDNPFVREQEWVGDMVMGFVLFCLKKISGEESK